MAQPSPSITLLDAATLDRGDLDLGQIAALGDFTSHPVTAPDQVAGRIREAEIVLSNKVVLDREIISQAPRLQCICVCATGVNNVDLDAAKEKGIVVCNVSGYSTPTVTQHTLCLLLNLATNIHRYASEAALWPQSNIFCRLNYPVVELAGKTLGVVGAGKIGSAVGAAAASLGMRIQVLGREGHLDPTPEGWKRLPRDEFFRTSDAVTLHCPLTPDTRHLINSQTLNIMSAGSFLINTGRGDLIDEPALADSLRRGHLGGAALDVLSQEPPPPDHPLLASDIPNLILTPHSAWTSRESRERLLDGLLANITSFLAGSPSNRVV